MYRRIALLALPAALVIGFASTAGAYAPPSSPPTTAPTTTTTTTSSTSSTMATPTGTSTATRIRTITSAGNVTVSLSGLTPGMTVVFQATKTASAAGGGAGIGGAAGLLAAGFPMADPVGTVVTGTGTVSSSGAVSSTLALSAGTWRFAAYNGTTGAWLGTPSVAAASSGGAALAATGSETVPMIAISVLLLGLGATAVTAGVFLRRRRGLHA